MSVDIDKSEQERKKSVDVAKLRQQPRKTGKYFEYKIQQVLEKAFHKDHYTVTPQYRFEKGKYIFDHLVTDKRTNKSVIFDSKDYMKSNIKTKELNQVFNYGRLQKSCGVAIIMSPSERITPGRRAYANSKGVEVFTYHPRIIKQCQEFWKKSTGDDVRGSGTGSGSGSSGGGRQGSSGDNGKNRQNPHQSEFETTLRHANLTDSHNNTNPNNLVEAHSELQNSIGGVGNQVGLIYGFTNSLSHLTEREHYFAVPAFDEKIPFSQEELQQIIRELAHGIFIYDTVPFFSLHFNADGNMYPVIHPVYEKTLVGRVISLLDYFMKGFLNGGFFDESDLDKWGSSFTRSDLLSNFKNLEEYCQKFSINDYMSLNLLMDIMKLKESIGGSSQNQKSFLSNKFQISFRIIAKQNHIESFQNLFVLHPDFDVEYTINIIDPEYELFLEQHRTNHGCPPEEFTNLNLACQATAENIRSIMPRLPICRSYFQMLNLINFICYYFKTLKQAQKIPFLPEIQTIRETKCPQIFPPLPIQHLKKVSQLISLNQVFHQLSFAEKRSVDSYIQASLSMSPSQAATQKLPGPLRTKLSECFIELIPKGFLGRSVEKGLAWVNELLENLIEGLRSRRRKLESQEFENEVKKLDIMKDEALKKLEANFNEAIVQMKKDKEKLIIDAQNQLEEQRRNVPYGYTFDYSEYIRLRDSIPGKAQKIYEEGESHAKRQKEEKTRSLNYELDKAKQELLQEQRRWKESLQNPCSTEEVTSQIKITISGNSKETQLLNETQQNEYSEKCTYTIHGGCGMRLPNQTPRVTQTAKSLFESISNVPELLIQEQWHKTTFQGKTFYVFKLQVEDFSSDAKYSEQSKDDLFTWKQSCKVENDFLLIQAIWEHDVKRLQDILGSGCTINAKNSKGETALHLAVKLNDFESSNRLIHKGWNVGEGDNYGINPFHLAAFYGHKELLTLLYKKRVSLLDQRTQNNATALYFAAHEGRTDCVKQLMGWGANLNTKLYNGLFPLYISLYNNKIETANALLNGNLDVNQQLEDHSTCLHLAVELNLVDEVKRILQKGGDLAKKRKDEMTPLHIAAKKGFLNVAQTIIDFGTRVFSGLQTDRPVDLINMKTKTNMTPLHLASKEGHTEIVRALLKSKADANSLSWEMKNALMYALENSQADTALILIPVTNLKTLNANKESVFDLCVKYGLCIIADNLIEAGYKFDQTSKSLWTYIHSLAQKGDTLRLDAILKKARTDPAFKLPLQAQDKKLLLDTVITSGKAAVIHILKKNNLYENISFDHIFSSGWTYLQEAAKHGWVHVIKQYYKKYIEDRLHQEHKFLTESQKPLAYLAAEYGQLQTLQYILEKDEKAVEVLYQKKHMLYAAIEGGNAECVDYILTKYALNANIIIDAEENLTSAELASRFGDVNLLKMLYQRGANLVDPHNNGRLVVYQAIDTESEDVVSFFMEKKWNFNLTTEILIYIIRHGHIGLFKGLNDESAALIPELRHPNGDTLLFDAVQSQNKLMISLLIHLGADINECNVHGKHILHSAIELNNTEILEFILKLNPIVSPKYEGKTPLFLACEANNINFVSMMLKYGANPLEQDDEGKTCFDIENINKHTLALIQGKYEESSRVMNSVIESILLDDVEKLSRALEHTSVNIQLDYAEIGTKVTPLRMAIALGKSQVAQWLLKRKDIDFQAKGEKGETILQTALKCEDTRFLKMLLENQRFDIHHQDNSGFQSIHHAIMNGDRRTLEAFIKKGADLYAETREGETSLMLAIKNNKKEVVELLLRLGYNVQRLSSKLISPLYYAVQSNNPILVQTLLSNRAEVNKRCTSKRRTALHAAVETKALDIVMILISHGANSGILDNKGIQAVHLAAKNGSVDILRFLVAQNGGSRNSTDFSGKSPLHYAAENKQEKTIKWLLKNDANVDLTSKRSGEADLRNVDELEGKTENVTPLHLACISGNVKAIDALIQANANMGSKDAEGHGPLVYAALSGNKRALEYFGHTKLCRDHEQSAQALLFAARRNRLHHVLFLATKIPLNISNKGDFTATHIAAESGSSEVMQVLLSNQTNVDCRDVLGRTPIQLAVKNGNLNETIMLIDKGANYMDLDQNGDTLLHISVKNNHLAVMSYLITLEFDLDATNSEGLSPIAIAAKTKHYMCFDHLLYAGSSTEKLDSQNLDDRLLNSIQKYRTLKEHFQRKGESLIHTIVRNKSLYMLSWLSYLGNINEQNSEGETPLHIAIQERNLDAIISLLKHGARIDIQDNLGRSALELAFESGNEQIYGCLLTFMKSAEFQEIWKAFDISTDVFERTVPIITGISLGMPLTMKDEQGNTLVSLAVLQEDSVALNILLKIFKMDPNQSNNLKQSPLHLAAKNDFVKDLNILLENEANHKLEDNDGFTPLSIAIENASSRCIEVLLAKKGSNGSNAEMRQLELSVKKGRIRLFEGLLHLGARLPSFSALPGTFWQLVLSNKDKTFLQALLNQVKETDLQKKDLKLCFEHAIKNYEHQVDCFIEWERFIDLNPLKIVFKTNVTNLAKRIHNHFIQDIVSCEQSDIDNLTFYAKSDANKLFIKTLYKVNLAKLDHAGREIMSIAITKKNISVVKILVSLEIPVLEDVDGIYLINGALKSKDSEILRVIMGSIRNQLQNPKAYFEYIETRIEENLQEPGRNLEDLETLLQFMASEKKSDYYSGSIIRIGALLIKEKEHHLFAYMEERKFFTSYPDIWYFTCLENEDLEIFTIIIKAAARIETLHLPKLTSQFVEANSKIKLPESLGLSSEIQPLTLFASLTYISATKNQLKALEVLAQYGNIHQKMFGTTLLSSSVEKGDLELTNWLLNTRKADPFYPAYKNRTAFALAHSKEIKEALQTWKNTVKNAASAQSADIRRFLEKDQQDADLLFRCLELIIKGLSSDATTKMLWMTCLIDEYYENVIQRETTPEQKSKKTRVCFKKLKECNDLEVQGQIKNALSKTRFKLYWNNLEASPFCTLIDSCNIF